MEQVFVNGSNIISSLGFSTDENFKNVCLEQSGLIITNDCTLSQTPLPMSKISDEKIAARFSEISNSDNYTRFEKLAILSISDAINQSKIDLNKKTLFILSSTKGNVELLAPNLKGKFNSERLFLSHTSKTIINYFNKDIPSIVVSNACISGVAAIILGKRYIEQGLFEQIIINGTDILSRFVVSGFQSFKSLSEQACKPFDANRDGLSIGEASATIILSKEKSTIEVVSGATSNDANHISGPSRTGEGLYLAIQATMKGQKTPSFISAHGTATPYNDDMESKAIFRSGYDNVETNSLKGYFGHTLGAAGVVESIISIEALKNNILIKTIGCNEQGTAEQILVTKEQKQQALHSFLKLASGFGGCNASALFVKHE